MGNSDSESDCSISSNTSSNSPIDDTVKDPTFKCRVRNINQRTLKTRKHLRSGKSKANPISLSSVGAPALSVPTKGKRTSK